MTWRNNPRGITIQRKTTLDRISTIRHPGENSTTMTGDYWKTTDSYLAMNQLTVRVRDLDALGGVLDRTIQDGANTFNGLTFGLADPVPALNEARKLAVADAMARAKLLTDAAGLVLGPVVAITEGGASIPMPMFRMADAEFARAVPVAAGEISTSASVTMVSELSE